MMSEAFNLIYSFVRGRVVFFKGQHKYNRCAFCFYIAELLQYFCSFYLFLIYYSYLFVYFSIWLRSRVEQDEVLHCANLFLFVSSHYYLMSSLRLTGIYVDLLLETDSYFLFLSGRIRHLGDFLRINSMFESQKYPEVISGVRTILTVLEHCYLDDLGSISFFTKNYDRFQLFSIFRSVSHIFQFYYNINFILSFFLSLFSAIKVEKNYAVIPAVQGFIDNLAKFG